MIEQDLARAGKVAVVGHRGAMGYAPENTLASFRRAAALGAHAFECDVRLTQDGEVVVIHDATVDRVSDGSGRVEHMTLGQLKRLDVGGRFGPDYAGERIPTLEEALELGRPMGLDVVIEIKGEPEPARSLVEKTVDCIVRQDMVHRCAVISFHHPCLLWARERAGEISTGILFGHGTPDPIGEAKSFAADSIRPHCARINRSLVEQAHAQGLVVHAWTVNDDEVARSLVGAGVDSLGTDYPDQMLRLLESLGRLPEA